MLWKKTTRSSPDFTDKVTEGQEGEGPFLVAFSELGCFATASVLCLPSTCASELYNSGYMPPDLSTNPITRILPPVKRYSCPLWNCIVTLG